jgi:hypothetical protein
VVDGARAGLESLATPCAVDIAAGAPLSVAEGDKSVELTAGQSRTINVSGGTLPITFAWQGTVPDAKVLILSQGARSATLTSPDPKAADAGPFTLRISDVSAEQKPVDVTVKVKKAK